MGSNCELGCLHRYEREMRRKLVKWPYMGATLGPYISTRSYVFTCLGYPEYEHASRAKALRRGSARKPLYEVSEVRNAEGLSKTIAAYR